MPYRVKTKREVKDAAEARVRTGRGMWVGTFAPVLGSTSHCVILKKKKKKIKENALKKEKPVLSVRRVLAAGSHSRRAVCPEQVVTQGSKMFSDCLVSK